MGRSPPEVARAQAGKAEQRPARMYVEAAREVEAEAVDCFWR